MSVLVKKQHLVWQWLFCAVMLWMLFPLCRVDAQTSQEGTQEIVAGPTKLVDTSFSRPESVTVGAYLNDIQSLDLKTHTYALDMYLWFRWRNPALNPVESMEFLNASEPWGHTKTTSYDKSVLLPTGELYQVIRVQGHFSKKFPLYNYPYDKQTLSVIFEDMLMTSKEAVYVMESVSMNPSLTLPGYALGKPSMMVEDRPYDTNFGDIRNTTPDRYSRVSIEIPVVRPILAYSLKLLLPMFCVVFCAMLMFLLAPTYVEARVYVGITSLLTIVALQMTLNQTLPDVGYMTLMDKLYLCSYLFIILGLMMVVKTTQMLERGETEQAKRLHRVVLGGLGLSYLLVSAVLLGAAIVEG